MTAKTGVHTGGEELTEIYYEEVMQGVGGRNFSGEPKNNELRSMACTKEGTKVTKCVRQRHKSSDDSHQKWGVQ